MAWLARRRHNGAPILFWIFSILVAGALTVGGIAVSTAAECGLGEDQTWEWIPPRWVCE